MRIDDDGLLQSLHEGVFETPLWGEFLHRLQAKTGARFASLIFRPIDGNNEVQLYAGQPPPENMARLFRDGRVRDPFPYREMRLGRAYALDELLDRSDPQQNVYYEQAMSARSNGDAFNPCDGT